MGTTSNPFTVGSSSDGSDRFLGILDEVFVCRVALAPADLVDLMNGQPPGPAPAANICAYETSARHDRPQQP